jgi:signal transduction histidine kinase
MGQPLRQTSPGGCEPRAPPHVSRWLLGLAAIVLLLIAGVTTHRLLQRRASIMADTERHLMRLDMAFAEQTGRAVETVDFILANASDTLATARAHPPVDIAAITAALRRRIIGVRQLIGVALTDADGNLLLSTQPDQAQPGSTTQLPEAVASVLADHRRDPATSLRIGSPVRLADGRWTSLLTRRISAPDGSFAGLAIGFLNLAYFEDFFRAVELDEKGAIVLHRRDGTVLARHPHVESAIGTSFANLSPFTEVLANHQFGTVLMVSPVDGSLRMVSIRALRSFPLAVNISVDVEQTLADWRHQTWVFGISAALVSLTIASLLVVLARRSRQIEALVVEHAEAREQAVSANRQLREQMVERERVELALRQTQRAEAIGQLTGGVAHDFNNLLTVVLGNIDLIRGNAADDPHFNERLATMAAAAERGATLTAQLLAFARRQPLVPRPIDINAMIDSMDGLLHTALGSTVASQKTLAPTLWPAMIDPTQMELVVLNLAINARDAMPFGGTLTIATSNTCLSAPERPEDPPAGDYVTVEMRDTGQGMAPEVLAKVFEPFFTTKGPGAGSGLGLSQVFGTARQSGGGVAIDSWPGHGTVVRVHLPRANTAARPAADTSPTMAIHAPRARVLVVDDDDAVRITTSDVLTELGYSVRSASCGEQALELLANDHSIDLLLTDVAMPGMSGPALARAARRRRPMLPILFISGYADPEGIAGEALLGNLVRKPFRRSYLAEQIELALVKNQVTAQAS